MNLLLLEKHEFLTESEGLVSGRRALHIQNVLRLTEGQSLRIGQLGGKIGTGVVASIGESVRLTEIQLIKDAPAKLSLRLIVALPRPKVFRRAVALTAALGIAEIIFINACKVDKSYWNSQLLSEAVVREYALLGLEQVGDTLLPKIKFERLLKPFVEDKLTSWAGGSRKWLAHPSTENRELIYGLEKQNEIIAIGPEGGWLDYEVAKFIEYGFMPLSFGSRTFKVETAIQLAAAKWFY